MEFIRFSAFPWARTSRLLASEGLREGVSETVLFPRGQVTPQPRKKIHPFYLTPDVIWCHNTCRFSEPASESRQRASESQEAAATYFINGKQFVVIACGGGKIGSKSGDEYVAFALPDSVISKK